MHTLSLILKDLMTTFLGKKYMLMALNLKVSHLGYKANPAETDMVLAGVSVPRTLLGPTETQARNCVARGPTAIAVPSSTTVIDTARGEAGFWFLRPSGTF